MKRIDFIKEHLGKYKLLFIIVCIITVLYASVSLLSTLFFGYIIDNVIDGKEVTNFILKGFTAMMGGMEYIRSHLYVIALILLAIYLLTVLFMHIRQKQQAVVAENLTKNLRDDLYDHIQRLPYSYHIRVKTGELIQKCTSDVDQIRRFFNGQLFEVVSIIFSIIIAFLVMFNINVRLALIAAVFYPFILYYSYTFRKKITEKFTESEEKESVMTTKIQEVLSGVRVVKAFNQELHEIQEFEKQNSDYVGTTYNLISYLGNFWGLSYLMCMVGSLSTIFMGIRFVRAELVTVGNFLVFITYQRQLLWQIRQLGRILSDYSKVNVAIDRLLEIKNEKIEDLETGIKEGIDGDIDFNDVYFHYDDDPDTNILNGFTAHIKKGETVAILGPTGSGKSSLIHLLDRLYDVSSGEITINGTNINDYAKGYLRKNIGLVLQEPFLFSRTIYDNLTITNPSMDKNAVYKSTKIASIHDVIEEFDQGYSTMVGEKGVTLSGGQKQRIAIARTIVNNCPIMIFDDSLSAVDSKTDLSIRNALRELGKDLTMIIITQRIASAKDADQILVIEEGRLTQSGKHDDLIKEEGLYKRIFEIQNRMKGEEYV